jgi:hypothetical protein
MPVDQWDIRIQAAREAQARSRFAFLASTIISISLLIAIFNFEFSWLRNFAYPPPPDVKIGEIQQEMRKEIRKTWIDSTRLKIPILGVDLAASDASTLGSISLYILTVWFYYCMRRENHLIGSLLIDADKNNDEAISLAVYHGVASYTVFTTIGGDEPINTVRPAPAFRRSVVKIRPIYVILLFLPALTIAFMLGTDILSLFRDAVLRDPTKSLYQLLGFREYVEVAIIDGVAAVILGAILHLCANILRCERATERVLRQFHDLLFADKH